MDRSKVVQFAKAQGYDDVLYIGKWRGYSAYEPVFAGGETHFVGPPLLVLVKGDAIRMSTVEEAFQQLRGK